MQRKERQKYHKQKLDSRWSSKTDEKRFVGIKGERREGGPGNGSGWRHSGGGAKSRGTWGGRRVKTDGDAGFGRNILQRPEDR